MRKMFSTERFAPRDRFRAWREVLTERYAPFEQRKLGDGVFHGALEGATIGGLGVTRSSFGPQTFELTPHGVRRHNQHHVVSMVLRQTGGSGMSHHGRTASLRPGDLALIDHGAPLAVGSDGPSRALRVQLPRERLERMLGPARLYAGLAVDGASPGASLARTFLAELVRVHEALTPEMAERMASVGVDLLVASLAERLAQETPKSIQGTLTVQRAKAHVEAHLGDHTLDPPRLAAAVGVSLRRLQELFHARGRHVSDHIWERRLEVAAQRLADPGHAHLSIGALGYGCGFVNQAHFAKRFRARFGLSPREHRRAALLGGSPPARTP